MSLSNLTTLLFYALIIIEFNTYFAEEHSLFQQFTSLTSIYFFGSLSLHLWIG
jgi:succinate dehydrogenase hydrophobic anchor subunit